VKILAAAVAAALVAAPTLKVQVGEPTFGLASGGGSIWAGGLGSGDVLRIDPSTGKVLQRVSIGARAFNLAAAPGAIWGIANLTNTAARLDTRTGKVTASVRVGNGPYDIEWGFGSAWVSNSLEGTVSRITGNKVVKTIKVGVEPNGLAAIGGNLWVTDHTAGKLLRLDPRSNRVTGTVSLSGADWVTGFGGSLYVSEETNVVARVDARTLKVLGRVKVDRNPFGSAIVLHQLWVPCIDSNDIVIVDPATMKVVKTMAGGPSPIMVLPAGRRVWISHTAGTVLWRL
jgi:DNA-binding beta-propeller fold protein YncE